MSATFTPSSALDAKLELLNFFESEVGERMASYFIETATQTRHHQHLFPPGMTGRVFADNESTRLFMAETFMVTPEMMDVCEFAARTLPDEEAALRRDLLPTDRGFLVFAQPRHTEDVNGVIVGVSAITWGTTQERVPGATEFGTNKPVHYSVPGVRFNLYTHKYDDEDRAWDWNERIGAVHGLSKEQWDEMRDANLHMLPTLTLGHSVFLPYNAIMQPEDLTDEELLAKIHSTTSNRSWLAFLVTVFTMMGQTLASVEDAQIERGTRKRMMRKKIPGRVTVIALRRKSGAHADPESRGLVQWQHRWVVRGHWRRQPYKDGSTKLIWINAFIKGPEDKPFKQTEKVYVLKR